KTRTSIRPDQPKQRVSDVPKQQNKSSHSVIGVNQTEKTSSSVEVSESHIPPTLLLSFDPQNMDQQPDPSSPHSETDGMQSSEIPNNSVTEDDEMADYECNCDECVKKETTDDEVQFIEWVAKKQKTDHND